MLRWLFLVCILNAACAFLFRTEAEWNGLKVTWGPNPFNSNYFSALPRTTADAAKEGWTKISDCDLNAQWRGQRYVKGGDYAVVLLYDIKGYIAGIQTSLPNNQPDGYPKAVLRPPFVTDGNRYTISAYFVDPATICKTGRSEADFKSQGTGTGLYIQTTGVPEQSVKMEPKESDVNTTEWTKGKCFPTMGMHYWHNLSLNMDCDTNLPVFLLYNGGKLNAFGWALNTGLTSPRYEHPPDDSIRMFMKEPPKCLFNIPLRSTMHIYLTSSAALDLC